MTKKPRLGSDPLEEPLSFIRDSRGDKQGKPGKQGKQKKRGRPKTSTRVITKSSQEGTKENYTRATFIVREDLLDKVKALAHWDRKEIKRVVEEALINHLKGRKIKPMPKEAK